MLQAQGRETLRSDAEAASWRFQPRGKDGRFQNAEPWMDRFLEELKDSGGNVLLASDFAAVSRKHVYITRARNAEFGSRWNLTLAEIKRLRICRRTRPRAN